MHVAIDAAQEMNVVMGTERALQPLCAERVAAVALQEKEVSIGAEDVGVEDRLEIAQALVVAIGALVASSSGRLGFGAASHRAPSSIASCRIVR